MKTKIIKLAEIVIDAGTQQREKINDDVVAEYADAITCGLKFPAVTTFFNGAEHILVDGFHRYWAHKQLGILEIESDIHEGTRREAILFSAGVNGTHGIRPTNADKKKSVLLLLNDEEWSQWSDNQIAKHCKVTHPFVGKVRKELVTVTSDENKTLNNKHKKNGVVTVTTQKEDLNNDEVVTVTTSSDDSDKPEFDESELMAEIAEGCDPEKEYEDLKAENEELKKIIEADDQLKEIKRLTELCRVIEERARGYQSSENAAVRKAKMWKEKFEKLERQVKSAGLVEF